MATVYAVASAKGGVGKTTTAANLAVALASAGTDVVAVDADIGMANLAGALGVDVDDPTLHDALAGEAEPEATIQKGPAGLGVIPGETELDAYADADPAGLADVLAAIDGVDYVILDCGAGLSHDSALPIGLADETLLVSTAERDALIDTEKTRELTDRLGGDVAGAAITRVSPGDDVDAIVDELLDAPILGRIPEDDAVAGAVAASEPVCTYAPHSNAAAAYRTLTTALTGVEVPEPDLAEATVGEPGGDEGVEAGEGEEAAEGVEAGNAETAADEPEAEAQGDGEAAGGTEPGEEPGEEATAIPSVDAENSEPEPAVGAEAATGDDAEAAEDSGGEAEGKVEAESEATADDTPEGGEGADTDEADTDEGDADATIAEAEPDRDEAIGSVPFKDSDRDVPGGESPVAEDEGPISEAEEPDDSESAAETEGDEGEEKQGFFSRLFGR